MVTAERDVGSFFSAGEEDDDGIHSPTDASEDSVDVKVQAISLRNKNKRKCAEPRRLDTELPAKKRKLDLLDDAKVLRDPFRPWSRSPSAQVKTEERSETPALLPFPCPLRPAARFQEEPLSLVAKKRPEDYSSTALAVRVKVKESESSTWHTPTHNTSPPPHEPHKSRTHRVNNRKQRDRCKTKAEEDKCREDKFRIDSLLSSPGPSEAGTVSDRSKASTSGGQQRNYKNMTRERRIEANARERTRVHTISAAFDTLRHSIPAYSHNQKLSKLSVLRIACSYIMTLSRLAGEDYSLSQSAPELADCVDNVSRTIQTEGKIRKKKDD